MTDDTLSRRARELLAAEYERGGLRGSCYITNPDMASLTGVEPDNPPISVVLAAIEAALRLPAGEGWPDRRLTAVLLERYAGTTTAHAHGDAQDAAELARQYRAAAPRHESGES